MRNSFLSWDRASLEVSLLTIRTLLVCLVSALLLSHKAGAETAGYFKFDTFPNGNGAFTDDTGKGLRGALGFPFSRPGRVTGPGGGTTDFAISLDGSGGLAMDDAAGALNLASPPLTMECWVRSTNIAQLGRYRSFISYGIPGGPPVTGVVRGGYSLGLSPFGQLRFTLYAVVDVLSGIDFPFDGQWHHVAASYSMTEGFVRFYLDGVEVAEQPEARNIVQPGSRHLDIGAFYTGLGRFDGDIDRPRISKAALRADQLDSVAGAIKPVGNDTLVFFNFDQAGPPYQGQGSAATAPAVSTADWVINHPPKIGASAGGPNATPAGPGVSTNTPSGAEADRAIQFNDGILPGGGDLVAVWDTNGVLNLSGDWTLEAWIKTSPMIDGERDVILYYGHPGNGYSMSVNYAAGNKLQVTTLGIADMPSDTATIEPEVWQHIAVAHKNGQSITYFVNGVQAGTRAYTSGTRRATTNQVLYIGGEWNGALPFTGLIDRVRISNTALTAAQLDSDPLNPATVTPAVKLSIARSSSNVLVSWPEAGSTGFNLEFSNTLPGSSWTPETASPSTAGGLKTVTVPSSGSSRFYRLRKP